jgi:hypothetical protein
MSIIINAKGTSVPFFKIGKAGCTLYQGAIDPALIYSIHNGDVWINSESTTIGVWSSKTYSWIFSQPGDLNITGSTISAAANANLTLKTTNGNKVVLDAGAGNPVLSTVVGQDLHISDSVGGSLYLNVNKWPSSDGAQNQVLTTDGSGNLTWTDTSLQLYKENASTPASSAVTGANSVVIGDGAKTTLYGAKAFANGSFANAGDAQHGIYVLRNQTTDSAPTQLYLDGESAQLIVPNDSVLTFSIFVAARRIDAPGEVASFKFEGMAAKDITPESVYFLVSSAQLLGAVDLAPNISLGTDSSTGALTITVIGSTSKTVRWVATVLTTEVTN